MTKAKAKKRAAVASEHERVTRVREERARSNEILIDKDDAYHLSYLSEEEMNDLLERLLADPRRELVDEALEVCLSREKPLSRP